MSDWSPLLASFWTDREYRHAGIEARLLFLFLTSYKAPSGGAVSGVYEIEIEDMAFFTSIGADEIRTTLDGNLHNVIYDAEAGVVFVKNKLLYANKIGGNPQYNARSVAKDRESVRSEVVWKSFAEKHAAYVATAKWSDKKGFEYRLADLFAGGKRKETGNGKESKGHRAEKITDDDIDNLLVRYNELEDSDDRDMVLKVFRHITINLNTSKPIAIHRRLEIAQKMAKEPPLKIANAAYEFQRAGCFDTGKRAGYFFGIVNGSSTSWWIEYKNARDKQEGATLI